MNRDRLTELLDRAAPPRPPADLRESVLAAASRALAEAAAPDLWERCWSSRPLRFAWSACALLLAAAHLALSLPAPSPPGGENEPLRLAGALDLPDLPAPPIEAIAPVAFFGETYTHDDPSHPEV